MGPRVIRVHSEAAQSTPPHSTKALARVGHQATGAFPGLAGGVVAPARPWEALSRGHQASGPDFSLAEGRTRRLGEGGWPACGVTASEAGGGESLSTRLRGQDLKVRSEPHPASARPLRLPRLRPAGSGPGALRRCPVLPGGARNPIVPSRDTFCCLFLFFLRLHFPRPSQIHRKVEGEERGCLRHPCAPNAQLPIACTPAGVGHASPLRNRRRHVVARSRR